MLNKVIEGYTYDDNGRVNGVKAKDNRPDGVSEVAKCSCVIADPTYFSDKVKQVGQIVRCINILNHPIPNTNNAESCQIIIPNAELKRKNDIYISCVSDTHEVAPKGHYIVLVSTFVETANPQLELKPGNDLLGPILQQFWSVDPVFVPNNNNQKEGIHISNSYDATSHFETIAKDVIRIYQEVTGETNVDYLFVQKEKPQGQ